VIRMPVVRGAGGALELREDFEQPQLGLPRDLDGNEVIDNLDHSSDYCVLPVELSVEWRGQACRRVLSNHTLFVQVRW